jgi:hypothetical protein
MARLCTIFDRRARRGKSPANLHSIQPAFAGNFDPHVLRKRAGSFAQRRAHTGNNLIGGGDGKDTVEFDTRATTDIQAFQTFGGVTIVTFTDGQKATMLDVQELVFTDDEIHL